MNKEQIKEKLLKAGVANLKEYGYPDVTEETILTDNVYSAFFESMLEDNKGQGGKEVDDVISDILLEIDMNRGE